MKKNNIESTLYVDWVFILFIFFIMFDPPINKYVNFEMLFLFMSVVFLITRYKKYLFDIIMRCNLINVFIFYLFIVVYSIVVIIINKIISNELLLISYIPNFIQIVIGFFTTTVFSVFIIAKCKMNNYSIEKLISIYVYAGLIQTIIVILTFVFPSFKEFTVNIMNENSSLEMSSLIDTLSSFRMFGFSSNLFDMFGYATGLLVVLSILMGFYNNKIYLFYVPFMFIMPLLNARTGLIIISLGIFISIVFSIKTKFNYLKMLIFFVYAILFYYICIYLINFVNIYSPQTFEWISWGYSDVKNLLINREKTGIFTLLLTNKFWNFPEGIRIIFGTGHIAPLSDVGYVDIVWMLGLLGAFLLFMLYIYIFILAFISAKNKFERIVVFLLIVSFWLYMFKLNSLGFNPASIITFPICYMIIYNRNCNYKIN